MQMIVINQGGILGIPPSFCVEMQAKHEVRMEFGVNQNSAAPNLAKAVKENLALPADRLLLFRIVGIQKIGSRLRHAVLDQNFSSEVFEIVGTLPGYRLGSAPDESHHGPDLLQARRDQPGHTHNKTTLP